MLRLEAEQIMKEKKVCIVSCSVLKEELQQLVKQGSLEAELVFVSKYFHVDYELVEKNLRKVWKKQCQNTMEK
jgi:gluconate kinase